MQLSVVYIPTEEDISAKGGGREMGARRRKTDSYQLYSLRQTDRERRMRRERGQGEGTDMEFPVENLETGRLCSYQFLRDRRREGARKGMWGREIIF